tara:strand:- start:1085 stop:1342 length:258 start_codon:yes stop_codon:yes gene_type:complete
MFSLNRIKDMNTMGALNNNWRPLNEREKTIRQKFKERIRNLQGIKGKDAMIEKGWLETERRMFKYGERSVEQMEEILGIENNFNS